MRTWLSSREFSGVHNFNRGSQFFEEKVSEKVWWGMSSLRKTVLVYCVAHAKAWTASNQSATGSPEAELLSVFPCDSWSGRPSPHPGLILERIVLAQSAPHETKNSESSLANADLSVQSFAAPFDFIFTGTLGGSIIFPFYRWGKWGSVKLENCPAQSSRKGFKSRPLPGFRASAS